MAQFLKLLDGIDKLPVLLQLHDNPQLWDDYTVRTAFECAVRRAAAAC